MKSSDFFANTSIKIEEDINSCTVGGHWGWSCTIDDGNKYNNLWGVNPYPEDTSLMDCYVRGFQYQKLGDEDNTMTFEWNGITQDSDLDDILSVLGAPGKEDSYSISTLYGSMHLTYNGENGGEIHFLLDEDKKIVIFSIKIPVSK